MNNLTELLVHRRERSPDQVWGLVDDHEPFAEAFDRAARAATLLGGFGVAAGSRVAVIGTNSRQYLAAWGALQLAGAETAMINPTYPDELLAEMLEQLAPEFVAWVGPEPRPHVCPGASDLDFSSLLDGSISLDGSDRTLPAEAGPLPGADRHPSDIAGYMHTSGTTGTPKFCAQTHEYFLRLGRFIADSMALCDEDTVFAPLPLFHINPLGYGVIGGLIAGSGVLSADRFSASSFWPWVKRNHVTALILHAPPVEILKRATTARDATGHHVRIVFFADADFMEEFSIPLGMSAYGSTEAGGLCHLWMWRRGDRPDIAEGMSRYGGRSRHEVEWLVDERGEIHVRSQRPNVLFEGYQRGGSLERPFDDDGWFATGDLGRVDESGNLVFIERMAESIRVKGEFVPIGYVEDHFAKLPGIDDVAVWRQPSDLVDDEVALYVATDSLDIASVVAASEELPAFMRPTVLLRVAEIPRDDGVGKIRRRQLGDVEVLEELTLS
ncbi:MAG: class I adenylate-forming enzyme family protein [Acidimicrobiales bacterium]